MTRRKATRLRDKFREGERRKKEFGSLFLHVRFGKGGVDVIGAPAAETESVLVLGCSSRVQ